MKNVLKLMVVVALVAALGFSFVSCKGNSAGGGGGGGGGGSGANLYTTDMFTMTQSNFQTKFSETLSNGQFKSYTGTHSQLSAKWAAAWSAKISTLPNVDEVSLAALITHLQNNTNFSSGEISQVVTRLESNTSALVAKNNSDTYTIAFVFKKDL